MLVRCRTCGKSFEESRSRGDWKGFCTNQCIRDKVDELGYIYVGSFSSGKVRRKGSKSNPIISEYKLLSGHGEIGSVPFKGD